MSIATETVDLIEQLYLVEGKAEIVDGRIVQMSPAGGAHNTAAGNIFLSLKLFVRHHKLHPAHVYTDNIAYLVELPKRKSFSPDVSYFTGPDPGEDLATGAPDFAVEVRSKRDRGPAGEKRAAAKRAEYFAAGTLVVWDVDAKRDEDPVQVYRSTAPDEATIYRRGEVAEAEPAVPGWKMPVDEIFE